MVTPLIPRSEPRKANPKTSVHLLDTPIYSSQTSALGDEHEQDSARRMLSLQRNMKRQEQLAKDLPYSDLAMNILTLS